MDPKSKRGNELTDKGRQSSSKGNGAERQRPFVRLRELFMEASTWKGKSRITNANIEARLRRAADNADLERKALLELLGSMETNLDDLGSALNTAKVDGVSGAGLKTLSRDAWKAKNAISCSPPISRELRQVADILHPNDETTVDPSPVLRDIAMRFDELDRDSQRTESKIAGLSSGLTSLTSQLGSIRYGWAKVLRFSGRMKALELGHASIMKTLRVASRAIIDQEAQTLLTDDQQKALMQTRLQSSDTEAVTQTLVGLLRLRATSVVTHLVSLSSDVSGLEQDTDTARQALIDVRRQSTLMDVDAAMALEKCADVTSEVEAAGQATEQAIAAVTDEVRKSREAAEEAMGAVVEKATHLKESVDEAAGNVSTATMTAGLMSHEVGTLEGSIKGAKSVLADVLSLVDEAKKKVAEVTDGIGTVDEEASGSKATLDELSGTIAELEKRTEALQGQLEGGAGLEAKAAALADRVIGVSGALDELDSLIAAAKSKADNAPEQVEEIVGSVNTKATSATEAIGKERTSVGDAMSEVKTAINALSTREAELKSAMDGVEETAAAVRKSLDSLEIKDVNALPGQLQALEQQVELLGTVVEIVQDFSGEVSIATRMDGLTAELFSRTPDELLEQGSDIIPQRDFVLAEVCGLVADCASADMDDSNVVARRVAALTGQAIDSNEVRDKVIEVAGRAQELANILTGDANGTVQVILQNGNDPESCKIGLETAFEDSGGLETAAQALSYVLDSTAATLVQPDVYPPEDSIIAKTLATDLKVKPSDPAVTEKLVELRNRARAVQAAISA